MPCFYVFIDNGFVGGRFLVCVSEDLKADYKSLCKFYDKKNISLRFVYENCIEDEERWRDDIFETYLSEDLYE